MLLHPTRRLPLSRLSSTVAPAARRHGSHMNKDLHLARALNRETNEKRLKSRARPRIQEKPLREGVRESALSTIDEDGTERQLQWENEADRDDVPMELRAMYRQLDNERRDMEEKVNEIVRNPDFVFYWSTLKNRIQQVELKYEESGRPFSNTLMRECDKEIEEVVYATQEEFAAYYKARDEKMFAILEKRMDLLKKGRFDPVAYKLLLEAEEDFRKTEAEEIAMLTASIPRPLVQDDDEFDPDEKPLDDDDIPDEPVDPLILEDPSVKDDPFYHLAKHIKAERAKPPPVPKKFEFKGDDANYDVAKGNIYQGYEKLKLYKTEEDTSAWAGLDRIFAHFKQREREKVHQQRLAQEQRDENFEEDDLRAFMKFLSKDSLAARAFTKRLEEAEDLKDFSTYELPSEKELITGKMSREHGFGSEAEENERMLNFLKKMPKPKK